MFFSIFPLLTIIVGLSMFVFFNHQKKQILHQQALSKASIIENSKHLIQNFDLSLSIAESKLERQLFDLLIQIKNQLGANLYSLPDSILKQATQGFSVPVDWSILNSQNLITKSSFEKDINLNLDPILGRSDRAMINATRKTLRPTTTKASIEVNTGKIKKYVYLALNDGYILELGVYFPELEKLTALYENSLKSTKQHYEDLDELNLFFAEGLNHSVDGKTRLLDTFRDFIKPFIKLQKDTLLNTDQSTHYFSFLKMSESNYQESWLLQSSFSKKPVKQLLYKCLLKFFIILFVTLFFIYIVLIKFIRHYTQPIDELVKQTEDELAKRLANRPQLQHRNDIEQLRYNLDFLIKQLYDNNDGLEIKIEERTQDLKKSNLHLSKLLNERDVLFKEVHHRVKNNLQLISSLLNIQASKVEKIPEAYEAFIESKNRVSAIAMFHEKMYQSKQIEMLDICAFLNDLVVFICAGLPQVFRTQVLCNNVMVKTEAAVTIALILNELIINTSKHGFKHALPNAKGELKIELYFSEQGAILTYSDNGSGLPADFNVNNNTTLGMLILESFCEKLGGNFSLKNRQHGSGVEFTCHIAPEFILTETT